MCQQMWWPNLDWLFPKSSSHASLDVAACPSWYAPSPDSHIHQWEKWPSRGSQKFLHKAHPQPSLAWPTSHWHLPGDAAVLTLPSLSPVPGFDGGCYSLVQIGQSLVPTLMWTGGCYSPTQPPCTPFWLSHLLAADWPSLACSQTLPTCILMGTIAWFALGFPWPWLLCSPADTAV